MIIRKTTVALAALLLVPGLASCTSNEADNNASQSPNAGTGVAPLPTGGAELADTQWTLSGASYASGSLTDLSITLDFAADQASGSGGVNTYSAGYTSTGDGTLTFDPLAATSMAGDSAAMDAEAEYFAALQSVTGYSVSGGLLDLFAGPDQILTYTSGN